VQDQAGERTSNHKETQDYDPASCHPGRRPFSPLYPLNRPTACFPHEAREEHASCHQLHDAFDAKGGQEHAPRHDPSANANNSFDHHQDDGDHLDAHAGADQRCSFDSPQRLEVEKLSHWRRPSPRSSRAPSSLSSLSLS
jgi:hypothetical protein